MKFLQFHISAISLFFLILNTIAFSSHSSSASNLTKSSDVLFFDDFKVESYTPAVVKKFGESDHFEFYSTIDGEPFWNEFSLYCDELVEELLSYWERPAFENLLDDQKIKLYLYNRDELTTYFGNGLPDWKCGSYKVNEKSVAIVYLETAEQIEFYESFEKLVRGTVSQLILAIRYNRQWDYNDPPSFFMEGFGLYFSGQRPIRENIINMYNDLGRYPELTDLEDVPLANYTDQYYKDLITSYVQYVKLADRSYHYMTPYEDISEWQVHWKHFYLNDEEDLIQLYYSSENFDIYCTSQDAEDAEAMANRCEEKLIDYINYYGIEMPHRIDVVVYPNAEVGTECWGKQHNGGHGVGGDKFDFISPKTLWGGGESHEEEMEGVLGFMIPHELFHVYHNNFWPFYSVAMGALHIEGLANFMAGYGNEGYLEIDGEDYNLWKIDASFANYRFIHNREPVMEDFMNNTADELGFYNDPYYFGEHFYNYLTNLGISFTEIRDFFVGYNDWSVYPISYESIVTGYISYLKHYAHLVPTTSALELPFNERFNDFSKGWGRYNNSSLDNWGLKEFDDNIYARLYNSTENIDTSQVWLVSPMLDASGVDQVYISFDVSFGDNITIELFYTEEYHDSLNETQWTFIEDVEIPTWDWHNTGEIVLDNPPEHFHLGIRYSSTGELHQQCAIDNFRVNEEKATIFTMELPFSDNFEETISNDASFKKWTTQNIDGWHYWHMVDWNGNPGQSMRFENCDLNQNDWLITKAINSSGKDRLKVNFDVFYYGNGTKPKLFYKSLNMDNNSTSGWTELSYSLGKNEGEWHSVDEIIIDNPSDIVYFAFQSEFEANQGLYFLLDNFSIEGIITNSRLISNPDINLKIYPNPVISESVISFQTKTTEKVNLSIYDLQGRKICTFMDDKLNAGTHTIQIGNKIKSSGIYLCKLATLDGISTLKLIVNNK